MNADWVMVIITGIYVIATALICLANFKSANASKEQLKEMQKQYAEMSRPQIEIEFHYIKKAWYIARFVNHGNQTAQHVRINIDQCFIDSLSEEPIKNELKRIKGKECIIGVGQHYDLFVGSNKLRGNSNMKPLTGSIEYEAQGQIYKSDMFVDLEHYMTFFSTTTDEEELLNSLKTISNELKDINRSISSLKRTSDAVELRDEVN